MNPEPISTTDLALAAKEAVDRILLKGYECTVDASREAGLPWMVTVVVRWPAGVLVLSREKLAAERRRILLGLPVWHECWLPLSDETIAFLRSLQEVAEVACKNLIGEQGLACEIMFDERDLKEQRKEIIQSLKVIPDLSIYGKLGQSPAEK